jgi:hypothetical protein
MRMNLIGMLCCCAFGCIPERSEHNAEQGPNLNHEQEETFRKRLLEIASKYKTYNQVDDVYRFTGVPCTDGFGGQTYKANVSRSDDESTHGRKLYQLYAANYDEFIDLISDKNVTGVKKEGKTDQVIVKESWACKEITRDAYFDAIQKTATRKLAISNRFKEDEKYYESTRQGPLFIMFQTDPTTPGTDEGWVYGTVTPDGKTVTGVGRLENCMNCHQKAPHGRLFGLPKE